MFLKVCIIPSLHCSSNTLLSSLIGFFWCAWTYFAAGVTVWSQKGWMTGAFFNFFPFNSLWKKSSFVHQGTSTHWIKKYFNSSCLGQKWSILKVSISQKVFFIFLFVCLTAHPGEDHGFGCPSDELSILFLLNKDTVVIRKETKWNPDFPEIHRTFLVIAEDFSHEFWNSAFGVCISV